MSDVPSLDSYWRDALSWDLDRERQRVRSVRYAWRVAAAGWVCAVAAACGLAALAPLKTVEPFVVRVDNSTGIVDVVPAYRGGAPLDETITRYFLAHYVSTCERFALATAQSDYEECGSFNGARRNQEWYATWTRTNPGSPLNVHRDGSTVRVQVESISFLDRGGSVPEVAQVRYLRLTRPAGGEVESAGHWIATVRYGYGEPARDPRLRRWNPLGFRVQEFRAEPEARDDAALDAPRSGT